MEPPKGAVDIHPGDLRAEVLEAGAYDRVDLLRQGGIGLDVVIRVQLNTHIAVSVMMARCRHS